MFMKIFKISYMDQKKQKSGKGPIPNPRRWFSFLLRKKKVTLPESYNFSEYDEASGKAEEPFLLRPLLTVRFHHGRPLIRWEGGKADSIDIYVKREGEADFSLLGNFTGEEFIDNHPLPFSSFSACWQYRAIYRDKGEETGLFSLPVKVTVSRQFSFS